MKKLNPKMMIKTFKLFFNYSLYGSIKKKKRNLIFFNLPFLIDFFKSWKDSFKYSEEIFKDIKYFTFFLGFPRSGHSLIGSILDAHPNIIISHELHALPYFEFHNFNYIKVFSRILSNSYNLAVNLNRFETGYNYNISYKYVGRYQILNVIGDKMGGESSIYLIDNLYVFYKLLKTFGNKLKIICVFRNPYDNIAAMAYRGKISMNLAMDLYFKRVELIKKVKTLLPFKQIIFVKIEDLIGNPKIIISNLCKFFDLNASDDYLDACCKIIYKVPHQRRKKIKWNQENLETIRNLVNKEEFFDFFKDYKL